MAEPDDGVINGQPIASIGRILDGDSDFKQATVNQSVARPMDEPKIQASQLAVNGPAAAIEQYRTAIDRFRQYLQKSQSKKIGTSRDLAH